MLPLLLVLVSAAIFNNVYGWSGSESGTAIEKKQKTNFYGTVETKEGNSFDVENITIDGRFRQIPVYEKPRITTPTADQEKKDDTLAPNEIALDRDPVSELAVTYIDLNEIREIKSPADDKYVWVYQRKKNYRRQEFVEIQIVPKDADDEPTAYIIERKAKIYCHGIRSSGPEEKQIPMTDVQALVIKGYCIRDDSGKCPIQKAPEVTKASAKRANDDDNAGQYTLELESQKHKSSRR